MVILLYKRNDPWSPIVVVIISRKMLFDLFVVLQQRAKSTISKYHSWLFFYTVSIGAKPKKQKLAKYYYIGVVKRLRMAFCSISNSNTLRC